MKFEYNRRFVKSYARLDKPSKKAIDKALVLLLEDFSHPSLRTKKIKGHVDIFEASASMDICVTFHLQKPQTIVFRNCGHHDRTLKNP